MVGIRVKVAVRQPTGDHVRECGSAYSSAMLAAFSSLFCFDVLGPVTDSPAVSVPLLIAMRVTCSPIPADGCLRQERPRSPSDLCGLLVGYIQQALGGWLKTRPLTSPQRTSGPCKKQPCGPHSASADKRWPG